MESNRHERSILIFISYIIGFVTAFIFYQGNQMESEAFYPTAQNSDNFTAKVKEFSVTPKDLPENEETENKSALSVGEEIKPSTETPTLTSSDGIFTFFCKDSATEGLCPAYILNTKDSLSYPIILNDNNLVISKSLISEMRWTNSGLKIGDFISTTEQKPWILQELKIKY